MSMIFEVSVLLLCSFLKLSVVTAVFSLGESGKLVFGKLGFAQIVPEVRIDLVLIYQNYDLFRPVA